MQEQTRYILEDFEIAKITFKIRFISDRQKRPSFYRPNDGTYEQSYLGFHRRDMFWIDVFYDNVDLGALLVEPDLNLPEKFTINYNHCKALPKIAIKEVAENWFLKQPEYLQQIIWVKALKVKIEKDRKNNFTGDRKIKK